jgi:hypothetical protein
VVWLYCGGPYADPCPFRAKPWWARALDVFGATGDVYMQNHQ